MSPRPVTPPVMACVRCGVYYKNPTGRRIRVCDDCRSVLTRIELRAWK